MLIKCSLLKYFLLLPDYQDSQKIQLCAWVRLRYEDNITLFIEVCGRIYFMLKFMVAELHKVLILHSLFVPVTAQFCHKFSYKRPEAVFLNVYEAQESIPRKEFRRPMQPGGPVR
jgi:hypothetical protein